MPFARWGLIVHRRRGVALSVSLAVLVLTSVAIVNGGELKTYQPPEGAESSRALELMQDELPGFSESTFFLVFSHASWNAEGAEFKRALEAAVEPLTQDPRVEEVVTPYANGGAVVADLVSSDARRAMVLVALKAEHAQAREEYASLRAEVGEGPLDVVAGGNLAVNAGFETALDVDLKRAEFLSLPLTLILLLVVFGTFVAAFLPLGVGLLAVAGGVGAVLFASHYGEVSVYALNIVTLIGLGVAIDYSLFIVSRYREELDNGHVGAEALARTMATAGRAVAFSGLTVAVGLLGLSFYHGLYFASMGLAGAFVVAFAVLYALVLLPALLAFIGPRVNRWRVPFTHGGKQSGRSDRMWHRLAHGVMRRPFVVLLGASFVVLVAASPFFGIELANATEKSIPVTMEGRRGTELAREAFPAVGASKMSVVVVYPGDPLSAERVGALYDLSRAIAQLPGVTSIDSAVDLDAEIPRERYQDMYGNGRAEVPADAQPVLDRYVGENVAVLSVVSSFGAETVAARDLVHAVRTMGDKSDGEVLVTGVAAFDVDTIQLIGERTPYALAFIVIATYVLLLLQTGSVVLPAKAVVMNVLSIAASFGALVWVFQDGHLSGVLGFTPAPIDPSLPILLFCIVFGLSMDYEVLLLSRMQEEYERTRDNTTAVAEGLAKSGRLITSAAAIMVVVFAAFGTARVTIIQAIGLGLALAIAIDATLVRGLIVPAAMRLMGQANWWAPGPLRRLQRLRKDP